MTDLNTLDHWNDLHEHWRRENTAAVRAAEMASPWAVLAELIPLRGRFLEVGCSSGGLLRCLSDRPGNDLLMTAVDLSPVAAGLARAAVPGAVIAEHDARDPLPFPDDHFDIVFSGHLVEHLADPVPTLREMARVVCAGGMVVTEFPYEDPAYPLHVHEMLTYDVVTAWVQAAGLFVDKCLPVIDMRPTKDGIIVSRKE